MDKAAIKNLIRERQDEIIKGIQESVHIDSVRGEALPDAPFGEGPKKALEHALALAEAMGFKTKNVDNYAGWAEYGEGEEMIAVLGHLDVVPIGEGWDYPAFGAEIVDGKIYGRGVLDDKGPTIGALYALKAIKDSGIQLDRRIRVIFGTDEECGSSCIEHYKEVGEETPVMGFTPDADYPLIFCEKGMTGVLVGKKNPVNGVKKVLKFEGGTASNVVTPKCLLKVEGDVNVVQAAGVKSVVEDGTVSVYAEGKSAHGSVPYLGENAAIKLLQAVKDNEFGGDFQNMMSFLLEEIGTETNGEKLGIRFFDEETGETTVNVGVVRYDEEEVSVTLDIRYPKNGIIEVVEKNVAETAEKYGLDILRCSSEKVLYVPKDSELVQKLMKVYKDNTGREDQPLAIGGGTYAKMFSNMVAFGPTFPGQEDNIHQPNECVSIENLMKAIELTANAMVALATK
ncbi:MAG: dipeptidase PepV [Lachnospiraceae bacterium]|nr:dipeptidase PepV [Lachnospiraceae bacterium]